MDGCKGNCGKTAHPLYNGHCEDCYIVSVGLLYRKPGSTVSPRLMALRAPRFSEPASDWGALDNLLGVAKLQAH